jgi:hypothetical protein
MKKKYRYCYRKLSGIKKLTDYRYWNSGKPEITDIGSVLILTQAEKILTQVDKSPDIVKNIEMVFSRPEL